MVDGTKLFGESNALHYIFMCFVVCGERNAILLAFFKKNVFAHYLYLSYTFTVQISCYCVAHSGSPQLKIFNDTDTFRYNILIVTVSAKTGHVHTWW